MKKTIEIKEFTNGEFDFLADMIHEKLIDLGHETDGGFEFNLSVSFDETKTDGADQLN